MIQVDLNRAHLQWVEGGLEKKMLSKMKDLVKIDDETGTGLIRQIMPISLSHMVSSFAILGVGTFASAVAFGLEKLIQYAKNG